jgi:hypothetical protein
MATATVLRIVSLAAALALLLGRTPPTALADNVVADDQIVQGNLCVGTLCVDGQVFLGNPAVLIQGASPRIQIQNTADPGTWTTVVNGTFGFRIGQTVGNTTFFPFLIASGAPPASVRIAANGNVGIGEISPSQHLHARRDQNANTFFLVQNGTDGLNANAVVRTQADTAIQNFQSHASSRTLFRWGVPLGGWNEFLSVVGNGLAMGTLGNAPFVLGTSATARMTFEGDSNVIDFAGGGQYDGGSFLDASSRALKQDIRPLAPDAAHDTLAALEPVTFAYAAAPGDSRVGFVAEDVPELVATPDRKTLSALEIVAVLTRVVKEQQRAVQEQQKVVLDQQKALAELTARLTALESRP